MDETLKNIEKIFRISSSPNELFDSFEEALKHRISDIQMYKILLGNPALSSDEVKMYSEKLIKEFPQGSIETMMWTGKIFENQKENLQSLEDSLRYYQRAFFENPTNETALLQIFNLYNYDFDSPLNNKIIDFVESSVVTIDRKSSVYYKLAEHFKQKNQINKAARYLALAEKSAERERD